MSEEDLKNLFLFTLDYVDAVFDPKTLREWLKTNRLHLTWGENKVIEPELYDAWVQEWRNL